MYESLLKVKLMKKIILVFLLSLMGISPLMALERVQAEARQYPYDAQIPQCNDGAVTGLIANRFADRETHFWFNTLAITEISNIKETGFRPNGSDLIPRRYCMASVILSDAKKDHLSYMIEEDAGIVGFSYGVEWCLSGHNRNYAYDGACRAAKP